jgi:hypothetical protein
MLKRIRPSIGSAHVIALLALFAALGGGYAVAFSGSGTLQKGAQVDIQTGSFEPIRTLTGIGSIEATCTGADVAIRFHNASGEDVDLYSTTFSPGSTVSARSDVGSGVDQDFLTLPEGASRLTLQVVPDDGSKAPQATVQVSTLETAACTTARVTVLALNTQE